MSEKYTGKIKLIRLDDGSASVARQLVQEAVHCGNALDMPAEDGPFPALRHALFCKLKFATANPEDEPSAMQCVAMDGYAEGCPMFGMTEAGESRGEHEKMRKLAELQRELRAALTYSSMGNFNTLHGSKFDKS